MSGPAPSGPGRTPAVKARQLVSDELWRDFVEDARNQTRRALNNARTDEQLRFAAHASRGLEAVISWFEIVAKSDEAMAETPTLADLLAVGDFAGAAEMMNEDL